MIRTLRCEHCDDVIGVYEPMTVVDQGQPRTTSRVIEPDVGELECYHALCYAQTHDATLH
jgi:hypothetical protein